MLAWVSDQAFAFDWERSKPEDGAAYAWPPKRYEVRVEHSHRIPMRDGVWLSADVYFPAGAETALPVVYIATPYGKQGWKEPGRLSHMFAEQGYVVVVQDLRGKFESEGQFVVEHNIASDLNDTANWIAGQNWSNGAIGMFGCSYLGQVQYYVAQKRNPHLKAFISDGGGGGGGEVRWGGMNGARLGGAFMLGNILPWMREDMETISIRPTKTVDREAFSLLSKKSNYFGVEPPAVDYAKVYWRLPLKTMMDSTKALPTDWESYAGRPIVDAFWDGMDITGPKDKISAPTLHMNSWYDFSVVGTLYYADLFKKIAVNDNVRDHQYRLLTPSAHCSAEQLVENDTIGDLPLGDPRLDYPALYLKWFDRWLRADETALDGLAANTYYTTGINRWRTSDVWPPKGVEMTSMSLSSSDGANSRNGDGRLVFGLVPPSAGDDTFLYDPAVPVMSDVGVASFTSGPNIRAQAAREMRDDVLVYTSEPLNEPLEVTGRVGLEMFVSSSARDTDFTAWLVDVAPSGEVYDIQTGILRARYREGWDKEVTMTSGDVYKVFVDMNATSHVFAAGHKVRLVIASSNFPMFDRNLNTGGDNFTEDAGIVAENTVHFGENYPSRLILPIRSSE